MIECCGKQWGGKKIEHTKITHEKDQCPLCSAVLLLDEHKKALSAKRIITQELSERNGNEEED